MMDNPFRIGYGFDLHQWQTGRKLVLGGVEIEHHQGLLGHSDADALTHAIIDALLGALALGDIGQHFPDTDPRYKGINSLKLLSYTMDLIRKQNYRVGNIDCTIVTDAPKMAPHIPAIRETLAQQLDITSDQVSVKATRTEQVLFSAGDGLLAMATALLLKS
jgi:2-C-methyl-D-erythritol 2,4-cyclodiphosphate synthase